MNFFKRNKIVATVSVFDPDFLIDPSLIHDFRIAKAMYNDLSKESNNHWTLLERMLELSRDCVEVFLACMKSFGVAGGADFRKRCVEQIDEFTKSLSSERSCERELFSSSKEYTRAFFEMNQVRFEQIDLVNMLLITARLNSIAIEESGGFYDQSNILDLIANRMPDFSCAISAIEAFYDDCDVDPREWSSGLLFIVGNSAVQKCESKQGLDCIIKNAQSCVTVSTKAHLKMHKIPEPGDIAYY